MIDYQKMYTILCSAIDEVIDPLEQIRFAYPEAQNVTVTVCDSDGRLLLVMNGKGYRSYRFENSVPAAGHYLIDIASSSEHKTLKMVVN